MHDEDDKNAPFEAGPDWERRYEENSTRWERGSLSPAFTQWQANGQFDGLRHIIIPGCGRSPEPLAFAKMGMQVSALDFAPSAAIFQRDAFAGADLRGQIEPADVLLWQPQTPADAVYDQTCLCALTPAVWADYEAQIRRWLTPGGRAFMLFMQTDKPGGPPFHCDLEAMRALFSTAHWQWPDEEAIQAPQFNEKLELGVVLTRV